MQKVQGFVGALVLAAAVTGLVPSSVQAGCGCQKPPPPRAAVRPFVGYPDQAITIFDDRLEVGQRYSVQFVSVADGRVDWSRGRVVNRRDLADGRRRPHLNVSVPPVGLGPCRITVWKDNVAVFALGEDQFTVTSAPIALHDFSEAVTRDGYQAGVGADGTVYFAVDVTSVAEATTFSGAASGYPLVFDDKSIVMYNGQGFLMQLLDPKVPGLFAIEAGTQQASDMLRYWRHEFRTYKQEHRQLDSRHNEDDANWHSDGSYHVDHDHILVAVSGLLADGTRPVPGATPPFRLTISSSPLQLAATAAAGGTR